MAGLCKCSLRCIAAKKKLLLRSTLQANNQHQRRLSTTTTTHLLHINMSAVLGKRKAREAASEPTEGTEDANEIFRRHFEAQFKPLQVAPVQQHSAAELDEDEETDSEDDSEWGGISDEEEDDGEAFIH